LRGRDDPAGRKGKKKKKKREKGKSQTWRKAPDAGGGIAGLLILWAVPWRGEGTADRNRGEEKQKREKKGKRKRKKKRRKGSVSQKSPNTTVISYTLYTS